MRASPSARGRGYNGTGVEPLWLVAELVEHCKTQGWKHNVHEVEGGDTWLIQSDDVAALVEGNSEAFSVRVTDLRPVYVKTVLACGGLLALTGAFLIAAPLTGAALWRAKSRAAKVESLLHFVDERIRAQSENAKPSPAMRTVADRIRELAALREQGLITAKEFETKREELVRTL